MRRKHHQSVFKSPSKLAVAACSAAMLSGLQSVPTLAQTQAALEEVIVTATRRDESLQDVAVSVAAITRELGQAQVRRLEDLQTFSPNTFIRRYPGISADKRIGAEGLQIFEPSYLRLTQFSGDGRY